MSLLKVGIIGTGSISNSHVRGYQGNADLAEIVAVADIVEERAKDAAARWGVGRHFTDYRKILDMPEVDAVSICTYNQAHRQPTVDALAAGKHVLCEKPMAATLDDAVAMTAAAQKSGRILMIAIHSRYGQQQRAAKRVIDSGALGRIYYGEAVGTRRRGIGKGSFARTETSGGGAVVDIGVYQLDTALDLLGHPKPLRVSGMTAAPITHDPSAIVAGAWSWDPQITNVEEFGAAWIRFEGGLCLCFKISWAIHGESMGRTFFLGEKGGIAMSPLEVYTDMFGSMVNILPQHLPEDGDRFVHETRGFLEAARDGKPSPIPPEQVIIGNAIMDGIYRSAAEGREVEVAPWESMVAKAAGK